MEKSKIKSTLSALTYLLILISVLLLSSCFSSYISEYVKIGIKLCFGSVIGAVFPFMILTDLIISMPSFDSIGIGRRIFEKIFNINGYAIIAFIIGIICGFPLGVKCARDLYESGVITKEECQRLIGFSNNTGPAFIISGVGYAMRGSVRDGVILYLSMVLSAVLVGALFGIKRKASNIKGDIQRRAFDLTTSVRSAAEGTLNVCAFVTIFTVFSGFVSLLIKNTTVRLIIISFLEVGNACSNISSLSSASIHSLPLCAFAISFSGISVHMQAKSVLSGCELSMKKYYKMKLLQGVIAFFICYSITLFK